MLHIKSNLFQFILYALMNVTLSDIVCLRTWFCKVWQEVMVRYGERYGAMSLSAFLNLEGISNGTSTKGELELSDLKTLKCWRPQLRQLAINPTLQNSHLDPKKRPHVYGNLPKFFSYCSRFLYNKQTPNDFFLHHGSWPGPSVLSLLVSHSLSLHDWLDGCHQTKRYLRQCGWRREKPSHDTAQCSLEVSYQNEVA